MTNTFKTAALTDRARKGKWEPTPAEIERINRLRSEGRTWPFIAAQLGTTDWILRKSLLGISLPVVRPPRTRKTLSCEQIAAIARMRVDGMDWNLVTCALGVGSSVLCHELRAQGIVYPPLATAPLMRVRMTLFPNEVQAFLDMQKQGRNFEYIAADIGVSQKVLRRELRALGYSTARLKPVKRARRGKGFWRSFDEPGLCCLPLKA